MDAPLPPPVGIDRLPGSSTGEQQKESMNCKSCRKKKIKCNRLKPSCNSCLSFQCPCIYGDAIPKKRGPKTEVLEDLIRRVSGIEKELQDSSQSESAESPSGRVAKRASPKPKGRRKLAKSKSESGDTSSTSATYPPLPLYDSPSHIKDLLDVYFEKVNGQPFDLLDRSVLQEKWSGEEGSSVKQVVYAATAVAIRYQKISTPLMRERCEYYAGRSRMYVDMEEPSLENVQALLLLSLAYLSLGKGKKSYMLLGIAIRMAVGLELHRELPGDSQYSPAERELRRKCFWGCYMMDRISTCGSKRPHLIPDESVHLRLPQDENCPDPPFFSPAGVFSCNGQVNLTPQILCIEIIRILGKTTRYVQQGGAKADPHLPWHPSSILSKIKKDLDTVVQHTKVLTTIESVLEHPNAPILVYAKEIFHLIHCFIYRQFMPIDLRQIVGNGQEQYWRAEATKITFIHANAIGELTSVARSCGKPIQWASMTLQCVSTAAVIHIHGIHFSGESNDVLYSSRELLTREMQHLRELRHLWFFAEVDYEILQELFIRHTKLVSSISANPTAFSELINTSDFYDRYAPHDYDTSHFRIMDLPSDFVYKGIPFENSLITGSVIVHDQEEVDYASDVNESNSGYEMPDFTPAEPIMPTTTQPPQINQPPQQHYDVGLHPTQYAEAPVGHLSASPSPYNTYYFGDVAGAPAYSPSDSQSMLGGGFEFSARYEETYGPMHGAGGYQPRADGSMAGLDPMEESMFMVKPEYNEQPHY